MALIRDKQIRREIAAVLKSNRKLLSNDSTDFLSLKELDQMSSLLGEFRQEANNQIVSKYETELSVSYLSILAFTVTCIAIDQKDGTKPPILRTWINKKGRDPNLIIQNLLIQLINYSLAIVRLVEDGLDNPARSLLRMLNELSSQILVLSSERDQLAEYVKAKTPEEANQVWFKLFAKGRLAKSVAKLEDNIGLPESLTSRLSKYRQEINVVHSQAVHHSYIATMFGSYAGDFESEQYNSALFGTASKASKLTLSTLNSILGYTLGFFLLVLRVRHDFEIPMENKVWREAYLLKECVLRAQTVTHAR